MTQIDARLALVTAAAVSLLLYAIPWLRPLSYPLELLATLVHELGHGVAAMLVGGEFHRLRVWPDGSGLADLSLPNARGARAFAAAGGLLGPPLAAAGLFLAGRSRPSARAAMAVCSALFTLALVLVVRNLFGAFLVVCLILLCGLAAWPRRWEGTRLLALLLAVQLALSALSRGRELFEAEAATGGGTLPSDVAQIAIALGGPPWVWGMLVAAVSLAVLGWGLQKAWRVWR